MNNISKWLLLLIITLCSCQESIIAPDTPILGKTSADIIIYVTKDNEAFGATVIVRSGDELIHSGRTDMYGRIYIYTTIEGQITIQGAIGFYYGETRIHKSLNKNVIVELKMRPH